MACRAPLGVAGQFGDLCYCGFRSGGVRNSLPCITCASDRVQRIDCCRAASGQLGGDLFLQFSIVQ